MRPFCARCIDEPLLLPLHMFLILAAWRKEPLKLVITTINRRRNALQSQQHSTVGETVHFEQQEITILKMARGFTLVWSEVSIWQCEELQ